MRHKALRGEMRNGEEDSRIVIDGEREYISDTPHASQPCLHSITAQHI
jgi:hypothetical protein